MNKKELAALALRERRMGRDPSRVLAAAISEDDLTGLYREAQEADSVDQLEQVKAKAEAMKGTEVGDAVRHALDNFIYDLLMRIMRLRENKDEVKMPEFYRDYGVKMPELPLPPAFPGGISVRPASNPYGNASQGKVRDSGPSKLST